MLVSKQKKKKRNVTREKEIERGTRRVSEEGPIETREHNSKNTRALRKRRMGGRGGWYERGRKGVRWGVTNM